MTAVLLLVVGGALGVFVVGRHTVTAHLVLDDKPFRSIPLTGHDLGAYTAPAYACLAGAAAVLATRGWARTAVGVLAFAVSADYLGKAVYVLTARGFLAGMAKPVTTVVPDSTNDWPATSVTAWPWLGVIAGVLLVVASAMVVIRGRRWPALGARYDAPGGDMPAEPVAAQAVSDRGVWDALDRGEDPT